MRKLLLSFATLFTAGLAQAQNTTADFEALSLVGTDTFYVNKANSGTDMGFDNGGLHFPYMYDTSFGGYWGGGFAYSNVTDSVTSGAENQYSAKPGKGALNSDKYVVFNPGYGSDKVIRLTTKQKFQPLSVYLTNSTFAYNSMRDGDQFAKKFGGVSGNDNDFFSLTIYGWANGQRKTDSVLFYLADYRFATNSLDYLVRDWRLVNLGNLGIVDSLSFSLNSSDTGSFGMNTPAYFCMDNLSIHTPSLGVAGTQSLAKAWPNPAVNVLNVELLDASVREARVLDISGRIVGSYPVDGPRMQISTLGLTPGAYMLQLVSASGAGSMRFIKQ